MKPWEANGGPDEDTLRELVEVEGLTDAEIGERYGVSDETARYYRLRFGITKDRPPRIDHSHFIPWTFNSKLGHSHDPIARLLRAYSTRTEGGTLPAETERRLDRFLADLAKHDLVVDYDREAGFKTRRRNAQIDAEGDIVRRPTSG